MSFYHVTYSNAYQTTQMVPMWFNHVTFLPNRLFSQNSNHATCLFLSNQTDCFHMMPVMPQAPSYQTKQIWFHLAVWTLYTEALSELILSWRSKWHWVKYFPCNKMLDPPFTVSCPVSITFQKHQQQTNAVFLWLLQREKRGASFSVCQYSSHTNRNPN